MKPRLKFHLYGPIIYHFTRTWRSQLLNDCRLSKRTFFLALSFFFACTTHKNKSKKLKTISYYELLLSLHPELKYISFKESFNSYSSYHLQQNKIFQTFGQPCYRPPSQLEIILWLTWTKPTTPTIWKKSKSHLPKKFKWLYLSMP